MLLLIEGAGQSGLAMNWGDGLAADSGLIQSKGISDTNPFFKTLLTKPYLNQVVAAPHVYPPSISKATIATQVQPSKSLERFQMTHRVLIAAVLLLNPECQGYDATDC